MNEKIAAVHEFHRVFGIGNNDRPEAELGEDSYLLRHRLMHEENEEYLEAAKNGDIVEIADALGDMMYILYGTICKHGLQHRIADIFDEIHRSNMSKLDADGKPIYREDGKVMKGENYFRPNIAKYLEEQTEDEHVGN
ncbi:MAG: nucleoside triphosphate pyrophosphohydrolase family protein [Flavobacteriales bacterium]|nr:nucleoside triphosphate pyrophosphohydrolase family protein [Flavobacteriales bacterium]